jgi:hypothetical protein
MDDKHSGCEDAKSLLPIGELRLLARQSLQFHHRPERVKKEVCLEAIETRRYDSTNVRRLTTHLFVRAQGFVLSINSTPLLRNRVARFLNREKILSCITEELSDRNTIPFAE